MMEVLKKDFKDRGSLIEYVKTLAPWGEGDASQTRGGRDNAIEKLKKIEKEWVKNNFKISDQQIDNIINI